jgi:hypothetical protein
MLENGCGGIDMKMKIVSAAIFAAFWLVMASIGVASASPANAPFKVTTQGTYAQTSPPPVECPLTLPCFDRANDGAGRGRLLGVVTDSTNVRIVLDPSTGLFANGNGTALLVSASGDVLVLLLTVHEITIVNSDTSAYELTWSVAATGSTGRYASANGSGEGVIFYTANDQQPGSGSYITELTGSLDR